MIPVFRREILAADFLYTFRRLADPAVPCPIIQYFDDKVLGMAAYKAHNAALLKQQQPSDYTFPIPGLETDPDPYTFHITLSQPYPQLRYLMAMHFTTPLAHEAVERYGKDLARHPVGSGAFVLAEYTPKGRIVLVKNPNFRADYYPSEGAAGDRAAGLLKAVGQPPAAGRENSDHRARASRTGTCFCRAIKILLYVSQENFQQVLVQAGQLSPEMTQRGIRLHREVGVDIYYFAFNMDDPTFGGLRNPTANCGRRSRWLSTPRL
jgi:ABC-type transport system substrate-binding protein